MKFNELNLIEPILLALDDLKYKEPTPIQEKTIPLMLKGRDVLGCAQTGSGKTAAFALPILQLLSQQTAKPQIRSLVLTPTRELAIQICENINQYAKNLFITSGAIYGGVEQKEQVKLLNHGVDVLVATPGRLLDLMRQGYIKLNHIQVVVLDEADRMLDMGFVSDVRTIIKQMPSNRQTVMFSATMPKPIERLADTIMKNPETVMQDVVSHTVDTVSQYVCYVDESNKLPLLTSLIKTEEVKNAIVFTNTRQNAEKVMKHLMKVAVRTRAIHGDKSQNSRQDALTQFKNGRIKVLVATDVAARGIDISKLSHVINYDIPEKPEAYIHRIGRTGRAGLEGVAINLCSIDDMDDFKRIEAHIGKSIPVLKSDWPMKIFQKKPKVSNRVMDKQEDDVFDITKVKDISLNGKPKSKKSSNYRYHKEKLASQKDKPAYGKDKKAYGQDKPPYGKDKPSYAKSKTMYSKDKGRRA